MRAKFNVENLTVSSAVDPQTGKTHTTMEELLMGAVGRNDGYPADGSNEDNVFALWTPTGELRMTITNPALFGKFAIGDTYYIEFAKAEK